jgi:hypothetical protein
MQRGRNSIKNFFYQLTQNTNLIGGEWDAKAGRRLGLSGEAFLRLDFFVLFYQEKRTKKKLDSTNFDCTSNDPKEALQSE